MSRTTIVVEDGFEDAVLDALVTLRKSAAGIKEISIMAGAREHDGGWKDRFHGIEGADGVAQVFELVLESLADRGVVQRHAHRRYRLA